MKLTFFISLVTVISVNASLYSQNQKLDLSASQVTIRELLKEIEKKSDLRFFYNEDFSDLNKPVSLNLKNAGIDEVLGLVLNQSGITYKIMSNNVVVLIPAQQKKVNGILTDASNGEPIIGANIVIEGTTLGTVSDIDGRFSLEMPKENAVLIISYLGYVTERINWNGESNLEVKLVADIKSLEEVVVVGYGTQKKVNMTGAVSSVKFEEMASARPITSVSSALSGLSSGVYVKQGTGKPGTDGATIRVRGVGTLNNSDPLVIIDGMEGSLDAVNPQDIESVSILKDAASASIYGSRAANGVILVTTKKGDKQKLNVSYNGIFSVAKPANLLEFVSDYPTYMKLMNESAKNIGMADVFSANTISLWEEANKNPNALNANGVPNYVAFPNTDWNKEMYQQNLIQDHTLSVTGATQNSKFLLSAGYLDNPGLVEYTGMKKYSFRANVEISANKWLTIGTRTYASMTNTELGNYSNMLTYIYQSTPGIYGRYNGKYGYPEAPEESATANNIYAFLYGSKGTDKVSRLNSTLYTRAQLYKGLTWDINFNYAKRLDEYNSYSNPAVGERVKFSTGAVITPATDPSQLSTYYKNYSNYSYTLESLLKYEKTFAEKHSINLLAGYNETYFYGNDQNATKKGLFDETAYVFNAATQMISVGGTATDWALRSYFGRLNYAFDQKYLLEANLRYDGSSRFDKDSRHGLFPSFSAGWRISEENFLKNSNLIQNLKLRASWGELGNNASGDYDYMALYGPVGYSLNALQVTGLASGKIPNPKLQWESTTVTNIGLDATILDGRLTSEIDVYNKVTDGILTTPPVYLTLGMVNAPTLNTAEVTNKGVEITLSWKDKIGEVNYSVSGNFGYNKNEVTGYKGKLVEEWRTDANGNKVYYSNLGDVSSGSSTRILEDHAINEHYLMDLYNGNGTYFNADGTVNIQGGPKDGMIRTEDDMKWLNAMIAAGYQFMPNLTTANNKIWYGDYIYDDMNGDRIYGSSYDRRFVGNSSMPKYNFGSQMSVSWKNFDLNLIWSGQAGVKLYWLEGGYNNTATRIGFQIWSELANDHYYYNPNDPNDPKNNINASYPRLKLNQNDGQNVQASTRYLYDGSFVRLKNLTLGYSLPKSISQKVYLENVRLYFSAENLFTITSFPGLDPEMGGNTNYPVLRQLAFGTNITF